MNRKPPFREFYITKRDIDPGLEEMIFRIFGENIRRYYKFNSSYGIWPITILSNGIGVFMSLTDDDIDKLEFFMEEVAPKYGITSFTTENTWRHEYYVFETNKK